MLQVAGARGVLDFGLLGQGVAHAGPEVLRRSLGDDLGIDEDVRRSVGVRIALERSIVVVDDRQWPVAAEQLEQIVGTVKTIFLSSIAAVLTVSSALPPPQAISTSACWQAGEFTTLAILARVLLVP